jgi:dihydroorotate dehydrogenase
MVARCFLRCGGDMPIVGVGGVENGETALAKIEAGATLVQIYTGWVYGGPAVIRNILHGLSSEIARRNLDSISARIGARAAEIAGE